MYVLRRTLLRLSDARNLEVFMSGSAAGPVVLFHQGTPGNPLRTLVDEAQTLGLRFVTTWRPGYGESTCQPGRSVADVAADTEEGAEDALANFREALRFGADGWIDDDLAAVKPWGFDVGAVAVPTTLWHGTEDRLVPVTHGQWLAARIPGVVAHFEEGEGHVSIGEKNMHRMLQELATLSAGRL